MVGMMIAMSIGMSAGLTVGVIFGILIPDNFFMATVLGIIVGMSIGFIAGIPVSIMAVLDGLLAGIMGGMMGAMLGNMVEIEYQNAIIKIMFFLFLTALLMLLYMIQKEVNKSKPIFYTNPLFIVLIFGLFFILFNQMGPIITHEESPNNNHVEDHH